MGRCGAIRKAPDIESEPTGHRVLESLFLARQTLRLCSESGVNGCHVASQRQVLIIISLNFLEYL